MKWVLRKIILCHSLIGLISTSFHANWTQYMALLYSFSICIIILFFYWCNIKSGFILFYVRSWYELYPHCTYCVASEQDKLLTYNTSWELCYFIASFVLIFHTYAESLSKFGSGLFLLVQVVLLLDFIHEWNNQWVQKDEQFWFVESFYLFLCFIVWVPVIFGLYSNRR